MIPALVLRLRRQGLPCVILAALAITLAPSAGAATSGFTAPGDPGVPALIASLRGCLRQLPAADRSALILRAGLNGHALRTTAELAAAANVSLAAESASEVGAIRRLESQRRQGACQVQAASAPASAAAASRSPSSPSSASTAPAKAAASGLNPGRTQLPQGLVDIALPGLLGLAFTIGVSREMRRDPRRAALRAGTARR